jgi:hypothetical protein
MKYYSSIVGRLNQPPREGLPAFRLVTAPMCIREEEEVGDAPELNVRVPYLGNRPALTLARKNTIGESLG